VTALCGLSIPSGNIFAFTMSGIFFKGLKPVQDKCGPEIGLTLVDSIKRSEE